MKLYTEPKLEIVTVKAEDVIKTSFWSLFKLSGIEDGGTGVQRQNLGDYVI